MRRVFWVAVAVGLGVLPALAAPPDLKVTGPDKPEPCKLVTVTADTTAKVVRWKVIGDATAEFDSGGRKVFLVGKGRVTVLAVAASDTGELSEFKEWVGEFGSKPDDGVKPNPGPGPQPPPVTPGKRFIVAVEETDDAAATRGAMFADPVLAARVKEKGHRWRIVDKDVKGADSRPPADIVRFLDAAKGKPLPQVFVVDDKGNTLFQGDMPAKADALIQLLEKWGG